MALEVSIEADTGAVATLWVVGEVNLNWFARVGAVALLGYLSEAAYLAGKRPLTAQQFPIQGADFDLFDVSALSKDGANPVSAAYAFVKAFAPKDGQAANPFKDAKEI